MRQWVIDHPLMHRLARLLGEDHLTTVGRMECFLQWCAEYLPNGDVSEMEDFILAQAARWKGDPQLFVQAAISAEFLSFSDGIYSIPNWARLCPVDLAARLRSRRRAKAPGKHSKAQWMARVEYHGWRCRWCRCALNAKTLRKDHVIPVSRGGAHWPSNLVPACHACNSSKNNRNWIPRLVSGGRGSA